MLKWLKRLFGRKAKLRFSNGYLVFYNQASGSGDDVGEEDFKNICTVLESERSSLSPSGRCAYDIILLHVDEGLHVFPTLIVATDDPGPKDSNTVLSRLFRHNNPAMHGSVESFNPADLRQLLRECVDSRSVNVNRMH